MSETTDNKIVGAVVTSVYTSTRPDTYITITLKLPGANGKGEEFGFSK